MANPYTGSNIQDCNSPAISSDRSTYTDVLDKLAEAVDQHDHSPGKGAPIPTAGIQDNAVTSAKIAAGAVTATQLDTGAVTASKIPDASIEVAKLTAAALLALFPAGFIMAYGGSTTPPTGFLYCDGSSLLRATYPNLFSAIGTSFGAADGTHFNLPDLRGQFLRGVDDGGTSLDKGPRAALKTGGATSGVGSYESDVYLNHFHAITDVTHTHSYTTSAGSQFAEGGGTFQALTGATTGTTSASATGITATNTSTTGGGETRPVNAGVHFMIKT